MELIVSLVLCLIPIVVLVQKFSRPKYKNLPPSPSACLIFGHLFTFFRKNAPPSFEIFSDIARIYGPIVLLKFGTQSVIVVSSKEAAMEVLKTNDRILSGRNPSPVFKVQPHAKYSLVWSQCNSYWKNARKILHTEIFAQKMLQSQEKTRERVLGDMVDFFRSKAGTVIDVRQFLFGCTMNVLGNVVFSKDIFGYNDSSDGFVMQKVIHDMHVCAGQFDAAEYFPILAPFDLQGLRHRMGEQVRLANKLWEDTVKQRKENRNVEPQDMLDAFLANDYCDDQIGALFLETFGPGSDTSSETVEWALSELIINRDKMVKLQEELDRVVGRSSTVKESDLPHLPYLQACIKETMRLHPAAPLLLPHHSLETCQVMGYTFPKNYNILVNIYAIGRDPKDWEDPLKFKPERFLGSNMDYSGNNFKFLPFGAGRRTCIGMPLAVRTIPLILSSLVHVFDWELPEGKPHELKMEEAFNLTLSKAKPLQAIPKVRVDLVS